MVICFKCNETITSEISYHFFLDISHTIFIQMCDKMWGMHYMQGNRIPTSSEGTVALFIAMDVRAMANNVVNTFLLSSLWTHGKALDWMTRPYATDWTHAWGRSMPEVRPGMLDCIWNVVLDSECGLRPLHCHKSSIWSQPWHAGSDSVLRVRPACGPGPMKQSWLWCTGSDSACRSEPACNCRVSTWARTWHIESACGCTGGLVL